MAIDIDNPPIFANKYSSWSEMLQDQANLDYNTRLWNDFVHEKTEEVMMKYVRELQMQELALTGEVTDVWGVVDSRIFTGASTIDFSNLEATGKYKVRDLWEHADKGIMTDSYSSNAAPHGIVMIKISKE